jgi:hypothetical protein
MNTRPPLLFIQIPEVPQGASFEFHPISRSENPKRYRLQDLRDTGTAQTEWVKFFEEILLGIFWKCGEPVPYVFRTADGTVRSLDAGCIKWLLNRNPKEVELHFDGAGIIDAVAPTPLLQQRYEAQRETLVARLSPRKPATP